MRSNRGAWYGSVLTVSSGFAPGCSGAGLDGVRRGGVQASAIAPTTKRVRRGAPRGRLVNVIFFATRGCGPGTGPRASILNSKLDRRDTHFPEGTTAPLFGSNSSIESFMKPMRTVVPAAAFTVFFFVSGCGGPPNNVPVPLHPSAAAALSAPPLTPEAERQIYMNGARTAWTYFDRYYQPSTGLAWAHHKFAYTTMWDAASLMAATWSARELGLISQSAYDQRIRTLLSTLNRLKLVDGVAFNTFYDIKTLDMVGEDDKGTYRPTATGTGYSVTDLGRLLIWLKILSLQPQHTQL